MRRSSGDSSADMKNIAANEPESMAKRN
jgi:hypothetical protein